MALPRADLMPLMFKVSLLVRVGENALQYASSLLHDLGVVVWLRTIQVAGAALHSSRCCKPRVEQYNTFSASMIGRS